MSDTDHLLERYSAETNKQLERLSISMERMASAVADLAKSHAVSEEKHANTLETLRRYGKRLDEAEDKIEALRIQAAEQGQVTGSVSKFTWTAVGVAVAMIFAYLFGGKH